MNIVLSFCKKGQTLTKCKTLSTEKTLQRHSMFLKDINFEKHYAILPSILCETFAIYANFCGRLYLVCTKRG